MVRESLRFKQQILFHCAGDRTAEVVFDALETVGNGKIDWRQKRVRIEHGDGVIGDLIPRAKSLGVIIVQNPTHFAQIGDMDNRPESLKKLGFYLREFGDRSNRLARLYGTVDTPQALDISHSAFRLKDVTDEKIRLIAQMYRALTDR